MWENGVKLRKDIKPMTPSKKLFDVTLPDTRLSTDGEPDDQSNPTKLDFTDAYEEVDIQPNPNEK